METLDDIIQKSICIGPAKEAPEKIALEVRHFIKQKFKTALIRATTARDFQRLERLMSEIVEREK